jgi:hypothetical protein
MRGHSPVLATSLFLLLAAALIAPPAARADDFKLKDGSTISGTIVGFEEDSFKVKTSYGYAIVLKDQVVSISISKDSKASAEDASDPPAPKSASAEKTPAMATPKSESLKPIAPPLPAMSGEVSDSVAKPAPAVVRAAPAQPVLASAPLPPAKVSVKTPTPPAVAANAPAVALPSAAAPAPPKPPAPEPIREAVNGNTYTNETYRFHMYKPPDWDLIAAAPKVLPGAITAMGTGDDMTYFLIGQEPAGKSIANDMDTTEKRLRDVMGNFRALDEKQITVSGTHVTEQRFRGSVDQHDWSGFVVLVPRGEKLFTIFGMTRADNDLVQIQENVIARAISSLQFTD